MISIHLKFSGRSGQAQSLYNSHIFTLNHTPNIFLHGKEPAPKKSSTNYLITFSKEIFFSVI